MNKMILQNYLENKLDLAVTLHPPPPPIKKKGSCYANMTEKEIAFSAK